MKDKKNHPQADQAPDCDTQDKQEQSLQTTHFGFESVSWDEKEAKVREVFHSVAERYDLMNDLMSLGIHRIWKQISIYFAQVRAGQSVLDLAGGTGDLTRRLSAAVGEKGEVILADINAAMLQAGRNKLLDAGFSQNIQYVQANAECLPFKDNHFHLLTMGFGLRNVRDKAAALKDMFRVCKPGGKLAVLEFSTPQWPLLKGIYDWYSFHVLPKIGELVAKDGKSYQYLVESIRKHPDQETLKNMIEEAGFEDCNYYNFSAGIVALHIAYKY